LLLLEWTAEKGQKGTAFLALDRERIVAVHARQRDDFAQTVEVLMDAQEGERFEFRCKDAAAARGLVEVLRLREPGASTNLTGSCLLAD
jgi:hypothetical protein